MAETENPAQKPQNPKKRVKMGGRKKSAVMANNGKLA